MRAGPPVSYSEEGDNGAVNGSIKRLQGKSDGDGLGLLHSLICCVVVCPSRRWII
jgi:hypothetical protein